MSSIANLYSNEIKKQFKVLYANWEPGGPVNLGDYGIMAGNIFIPKGNLANDFDEFKDVLIFSEDPLKDQKEFVSEGGVDINFIGKGSGNVGGITAKASVEIKFAHKDSIFFNAAECTTTRISNKAKVGELLKAILKKNKGRWLKEYCIVTDIVKAGRTIVAISASDNAGISFSADSPAIENIDLADASVKLGLTTQRSIGYKVGAIEGLDLLIGLCKLKNPFLWWGGEFRPRTLRMTDEMINRIEDAPGIKTETSSDELIFVQLGKD